jgi:hypothetical protein
MTSTTWDNTLFSQFFNDYYTAIVWVIATFLFFALFLGIVTVLRESHKSNKRNFS